LHDYSDPISLGVGVEEFTDGVHSGERMALIIYSDLVRQHPDLFEAYSKLKTLETMIAEANDPYYVFPSHP
jgi:hypothetical protein